MNTRLPVVFCSKRSNDLSEENCEISKRFKSLNHINSTFADNSMANTRSETSSSATCPMSDGVIQNTQQIMEDVYEEKMPKLFNTDMFGDDCQLGVSETSADQTTQQDTNSAHEEQNIENETSNSNQSSNAYNFLLGTFYGAIILLDQNQEHLSQVPVDAHQTNFEQSQNDSNELTVAALTDLRRILYDADAFITQLTSSRHPPILLEPTINKNNNQENTLSQPLEPRAQQGINTNNNLPSVIDLTPAAPNSVSTFEPPVGNTSLSSSSVNIQLSPTLERSFHGMNEDISFELNITNQPDRFNKPRTLNCLSNGECTMIQRERQSRRQDQNDMESSDRSQTQDKVQKLYPTIKSTKLNGNQLVDYSLYKRIEMLNERDEPHKQKMILTPNAKINPSLVNTKDSKKNTRYEFNDVLMDGDCGYSEDHCAILAPISEKDIADEETEILFKVANRYRKPKSIRKGNNQSSSKETGSLSDGSNRKVFKFRVCYCRLDTSGDLIRVSNFVTSWLIQEGIKELKIESVLPHILNPVGKEKITVQFNTPSEKTDIEIYLNAIQIKSDQYRMDNSRTIIFDSIPKTDSPQAGLHVKIVKKNFLETNTDVNGWKQRFVDKTLYDKFICYA